jgi:hypothetical protein
VRDKTTGRRQMVQTENYRIMDIEKCTLNGRNVKMFKYYERKGDVYVFSGQFSAPAKTANKNLINFVD